MYDEMPGIGFAAQNDDLFLSKNGVLIYLLKQDGRLHVMIEVGEDSTARNIQSAIPLACEWRDRVMEYQGAWQGGGDNQFLEMLHYMNKGGVSYAELAKRINAKFESHLREAIAFDAELRKVLPRLKTQGDYLFWSTSSEQKYNPFSLDHAKGLLKAIRIRDDEIEIAIKDGEENIRAGKEPFKVGYPVSQRKVIETLRTWREGLKHKSIEKREKIAREKVAREGKG